MGSGEEDMKTSIFIYSIIPGFYQQGFAPECAKSGWRQKNGNWRSSPILNISHFVEKIFTGSAKKDDAIPIDSSGDILLRSTYERTFDHNYHNNASTGWSTSVCGCGIKIPAFTPLLPRLPGGVFYWATPETSFSFPEKYHVGLFRSPQSNYGL
jgi:hypothetical protein